MSAASEPGATSMRRFRVAQIVAAVLVILFVVFAVLSWRGTIRDPLVVAYTIVAFQIVSYAAATAGLTRAAVVSQGRRTWAWGCLATSAAIAALGILAIVGLQGRLPQDAFTFGLFILVNGLGLTGILLLLPRRIRFERQAVLILDALVAAGSLFVILWILVLGRLFAASPAPFFGRLTTVLYPSLSVAVLTLVILVFSRTPQEVRAPLRYLLAAWSIAAVGLPLYTYLALEGHAWASYFGPGTVVAALSIQMLAGLRVTRGQNVPGRLRQSAAEYLPYAPLGLAMLVVIRAYATTGGVAPVVFWVSAGVVVLVVARLLLAQRESVAINRELARAVHFKTEMLRFIGHEIAGPLTPLMIQKSIMAQAESEGTPLDERAKRNLETFSRSLSRLESLSQDVRALAQLDAGHLPIEKQEHDMVVETRRAVDAARPAAERRALQLRFITPKAPAPAMIDAQRYGQVVDNLLSNSIKFTPKGGAIDVAVAEEPGGWTLIVQDTGLGLTQGQRSRLFTAFGRAHGIHVPGLGLGLVICKGIVEGHGGTITVDSPGPKRGTQFRATFPALLRPFPVVSPASA